MHNKIKTNENGIIVEDERDEENIVCFINSMTRNIQGGFFKINFAYDFEKKSWFEKAYVKVLSSFLIDRCIL